MRLDAQEHLFPDQRLNEFSAILAEGITRLFALRIDVIETQNDASNSAQIGLDVSPEQSVHVPRVNATREQRRS